jgi:hypothetical protein
VDDAAIAELLNSPAGPVAARLIEVTQQVVQRAKVLAPVGAPSKTPAGHPAGYLRSQIHWSLTAGAGLGTRVHGDAITSQANVMPGENYGYQNETGTWHRGLPEHLRGHAFLVPALEQVFAEL